MPLYVYRCPDCGHIFDRLVSMSRRDDTQECPECGSTSTSRAMTAAATMGRGGDGTSSAAAAMPAPPRFT